MNMPFKIASRMREGEHAWMHISLFTSRASVWVGLPPPVMQFRRPSGSTNDDPKASQVMNQLIDPNCCLFVLLIGILLSITSRTALVPLVCADNYHSLPRMTFESRSSVQRCDQ